MSDSTPDLSEQPEVMDSVPRRAGGLQWVLDQRWPLANIQIILIVLIIIGGRLAFDFSQRIIEGQQKIAQEQFLETRIELLKQEQENLQADKQYYSSEAYVESWAHDEGKMIRDGEKLVVPVFKGESSVTSNSATLIPLEKSQQKQLAPWQVWWILFFDSPPLFSNNP